MMTRVFGSVGDDKGDGRLAQKVMKRVMAGRLSR